MKLPSGTQFKSLAFDVKTLDADQGIVTGYLSTFGNVDEQSDRVVRGAFKKTIADALSRKMTGRKFLWPMLWMHDPTQAIGLFIDAKEDDHGLFVTAQLDVTCNAQGHPNNPIATRVFSGFKIGYVDEMSIGYRPILADYTKVDNVQVRDLKEIQLVEGSAVTSLFAADPLALVTGVKTNVESKVTICGSTAGPIGPRDESWDSASAKSAIWNEAEGDDGSLNVALCKKYFMTLDGDPQNKGSWGYPFWIAGDNAHICVGSVKAIAGLVQGARGAEAPAGIKSKIETLYRRINAKYPKDTPLVPPWKSSVMALAVKTFEEHYREEMCEDLLEDLDDVLFDSLKSSIMDAVTIGDTPNTDVTAALSSFGDALTEWLADAVKYDLSAYLASQGSEDDDYRPPLNTMSKAGARISATTRAALQDHVDNLHAYADKSMQYGRDLHKTADGLTTLWEEQGLGDPYDKESNGPDALKRREPHSALTREHQPETPSTDTDAELSEALARLTHLRTH